MALYFECRINKSALLQTVFFGDFADWVIVSTGNEMLGDVLIVTLYVIAFHLTLTII